MKSFKDLREKTLTPAEKKKREEIAKAMERENPGMDMKKKMAISTWQAKKIAEAKDPNEYDKEGAMMKNQLRQICSANEKLMKMVGDDDNLPEWVQNKVTKATDYIRTVRDYLEAENDEDDEDKEDEDDEELDEAVKIGSKVRIHAPGKDYHGKVGHVGEIRRGAFAKAPPSYTIDYREPGEDRNRSVMLSKEKIKLHKESVDLDEVSKDTLGRYASKALNRGDIANRMSKSADDGMGKIANKRLSGVKKAVDKLADKTGKKALATSIKKDVDTAKASGNAFARGGGVDDQGKSYYKAMRNIGKMREEAALDKVSDKKLDAYRQNGKPVIRMVKTDKNIVKND